MKIIEFAPYAFFKGHREFNKTTGAAFAIADIAEGLAQENEVYLLTQSAITKGFVSNKVNVIKRTWFDIFKNASLTHILDGIRAGRGIVASWTYRLKIILYFLSQGHAESVLRELKPDIAHIESVGFYTLPFMRACLNCNIPFVISNHGLGLFLEEGELDKKQRNMELELYRLSGEKGLLISCVSTGIIKRVCNTYGLSNNNIRKIGNCIGHFEPVISSEVEHLKTKYGIDENDKVIVCLGSICNNKNQIQVARAYTLLDEKIKEHTKLIFLGTGPQEEVVKKFIIDKNVGNVFFAGYVEHEKLGVYYTVADLNITASKDEGFGLPIIEGFSFGIPTVAFNDIDAVEDLYFEHGMYLATSRSDECLSETLLYGLDNCRKYNDLIYKESMRFNKQAMAQEYMNLFYDALTTPCLITSEELDNLL